MPVPSPLIGFLACSMRQSRSSGAPASRRISAWKAQNGFGASKPNSESWACSQMSDSISARLSSRIPEGSPKVYARAQFLTRLGTIPTDFFNYAGNHARVSPPLASPAVPTLVRAALARAASPAGRYGVKAASGASFFGCYERVFPTALEQFGSFQSSKRLVQSTVRRQQARALPFLDLLGYEEAVKTRQSVGSQTDASVKNGELDWQKGVGFSSHEHIIGRYIPKSQGA